MKRRRTKSCSSNSILADGTVDTAASSTAETFVSVELLIRLNIETVDTEITRGTSSSTGMRAGSREPELLFYAEAVESEAHFVEETDVWSGRPDSRQRLVTSP